MKAASEPVSKREIIMNGLNMVQSALLGNLQRLEDYLQSQLNDDVEMIEYNSQAASGSTEQRPPLNFDDEDSQDDVENDEENNEDGDDTLAMKFDKQGENDCVPQSPPSQAQEEAKKEEPEKVSAAEIHPLVRLKSLLVVQFVMVDG